MTPPLFLPRSSPPRSCIGGANCTQPQWEAVGDYSTTLFTSRAVAVVDAHDQTVPMFMYLAYQAVHAPRESPQSYIDAYDGIIVDKDRKVFAGMLSCMDEGIGNFTAALSAKGMLDNTFIVFSTDNGGQCLKCGNPLPAENLLEDIDAAA